LLLLPDRRFNNPVNLEEDPAEEEEDAVVVVVEVDKVETNDLPLLSKVWIKK